MTKRRPRLQSAWRWLRSYLDGSSLLTSLGILVFCIIVIFIWHNYWFAFGPDYRVEFVGLIFDVFFILIVFSVFEHRRQRAQNIQRQVEIIEDYKSWDTEEGRLRLAGAMRRLNKQGVHAFYLDGLRLHDFSFSENGIRSIVGTIFYSGEWGEPFKKLGVELTRVNFGWANCSKVQFSPFSPFRAVFKNSRDYAILSDCDFSNARLNGASFNGATLRWSQKSPASLHDLVSDEDGSEDMVQLDYGPFDNADLSGASFRNTRFENADFRGTRNIADADFTDAEGLESCVFDVEALENEVLRNAKVGTG